MSKTRKPRRIAFVTDAIYPYNMGGKEKRLYEIATRLVKPDQEVHIYTMKWWDGPSHIVRDGLNLHAISKLYPLYTGERRSMTEAIMFGLATFKLLFARFDVIDVDSMPFFPVYSARIVCWLRFKRLNATWHEVTPLSVWQSYAGKLSGTIAFAIERVAAYLPDRIIANSNLTTNRLLASGVRCRIDTVSLGVNVDYIYAMPAAEVKSDVIFTGRLLAHKNADMLIRAIAIVAKQYPKVVCTIVGDGPERASLEKLIRQLGLEKQVRMLGFIEDAGELYSLMKSAKMFVLPSTREGFGIVALEAHAAGLPVITTNHADNNARNLIKDGVNGFLSDATPEAIAASIIKVLEHGKSLSPRADIQRHDWTHIASSVEHALGV